MDQKSAADLVVIEPFELTASGLHGRLLFRTGDQAGAVWFCLGDRLLVTPPATERVPVGAWDVVALTELHIRRLRMLGVIDAPLAEAARAWLYR